MILDSRGLGRLQRVATPREVWQSESGDFTPWLADNLDVLAEELGIALTLIATEVPVGEFRLDIQAQTQDGLVVIIENQLERSDHGHLGQLLAYASGLEAAAVVWIAPAFREEHRRTLDWLNERTDGGINFFGVEVSVVQIGERGPRAPVFDVIARPNDWQKGVKEAAARSATGGRATGVNVARQDFFQLVMEDVVASRPAIRMPARGSSNWLAFASGPFGNWDISVANDGRMRIEAYLDTGDRDVNKALFDELFADAAKWEQLVGRDLSWERLDDKRACRIATYLPVMNNADPSATPLLREQAVEAILAMYDGMNVRLRERASQLRRDRPLKQE